MWEIIIRILLGLFLAIAAIQDLMKKKIKVWTVIVSAILLCICIPFCPALSFIDRICGLLIGIGVVLLAKLTGEKIGLGDGLVLCVTGLGLGFWSNLELFALALTIAAVFSIILLVLRLANRKKSIPFLPFVLISYLFFNIPVWDKLPL